MANTIAKPYTELQVGDIVHFYGARFRIFTALMVPEVGMERLRRENSGEPLEYMSAYGKWIDGEIEPGYFGPIKDWHFQGNVNARCVVEVTK